MDEDVLDILDRLVARIPSMTVAEKKKLSMDLRGICRLVEQDPGMRQVETGFFPAPKPEKKEKVKR